METDVFPAGRARVRETCAGSDCGGTMMTACFTKRTLAAVCGLLLMAAQDVGANGLLVTNVTVSKRNETTAYVTFDIAWQNSWRFTNINHDAAWVFFKARQEGQSEWHRVLLEGTGVNPQDYSNGVGTAVDLIVPSDRMGLFVRRAAQGSGALAVTNIQAVWNIASANVTKTFLIQIRALAAEMVYVAEGAFKVGSGGTEVGSFTDGSWTNGVTIPFRIASEDALTVSNAAGCLWGTVSGSTKSTIGDKGTLPAAFPKGYAAFYCMKEEATQGQYADFLNTLTVAQLANRYSSTAWNRYTISVSNGVYSASVPDRVCNGLCYGDAAAFLDWAGLRPYTELEFEKACRGPLDPIANEYPWGTTAIGGTTGVNNDGTGLDTAASGNCNCNSGSHSVYGPYRAGIYATASSTREAAGASYWGILGLAGSLWEYVVAVDSSTGRAFSGLHGDGNLTAAGYADVADWPGANGVGIGFRGGSYQDGTTCARVSDRNWCGGYSDGTRNSLCCCRGVRTAPAGVLP